MKKLMLITLSLFMFGFVQASGGHSGDGSFLAGHQGEGSLSLAHQGEGVFLLGHQGDGMFTSNALMHQGDGFLASAHQGDGPSFTKSDASSASFTEIGNA